jgi:hypothetical protein
LIGIGYSGFSWFEAAPKVRKNRFEYSATPARALVLFEDRFTALAMTASGVPTSLLLSDGSAILEVLMMAQRLGVFLTP